MNILHIIPANTGTIYYFLKEFCNSNDDKNIHEFLVTNNRLSVMKQNTKLLAFPELNYMIGTENGLGRLKRFLNLYNVLKRYDKIVWHSFIPLRGNYTILLFFSKKLLMKSAWVEWGEDLLYQELPTKKIRQKFKQSMMYLVKSKIPTIGITMPTDKYLLSKHKQKKQDVFFVRYPIPKDILDKINSNYNKKNEKLGIQVGLSSHEWNKHIELFTLLERYREENIHIYVPANYYLKGNYIKDFDKKYTALVKQKGNEIFNNNFTLLRNSVSIEIFFRYLELIDIVILAEVESHEYEYTMTYLMLLLSLGKKVFLPNESRFHKHLRENNIEVFSIDDLTNLNFEKVMNREKDLNKGNQYISNYFDSTEIVKSWKKMFNF